MGKSQAALIGIVSLLLITKASLCSLGEMLNSNLPVCSESGASLARWNLVPPLVVALPSEILDRTPWLLMLPLKTGISIFIFWPSIEDAS